MTEQTLVHGLESGLTDLRTGALLRITTAIETAETLDELLMLALHQFNELLAIQFSGVVLVDERLEYARLVSVYPPRVSLPGEFALEQAHYLRSVFLQRQIVQLYDVQEELPPDKRSAAIQEIYTLLDQLAVRSVLMVPLIAQDKLIGLLAFATVAQAHRFTESEISLVRLMSGQLAAAITSFRTTERAQRRTEELETLNDIAAAVTS
jgi:two-component system, NtrC family, sensor histidine kinase KinB